MIAFTVFLTRFHDQIRRFLHLCGRRNVGVVIRMCTKTWRKPVSEPHDPTIRIRTSQKLPNKADCYSHALRYFVDSVLLLLPSTDGRQYVPSQAGLS